MKDKVIFLDFDGTIHTYRGFKGECVLDGEPIIDLNGYHAFDFIRDMLDAGLIVQIFSTRGRNSGFEHACDAWFEKYGLELKYRMQIRYGYEKSDHHYIIDDRAGFNGVYPTISFLKNFKPWYKRSVP